MLEFILARYNYWIVIILMMTGLYIVFSRGNLVKTLIGLNLFQTSVFIFYITIGKVIGGTAPILIETKDKKASDHGGGHDNDHGAATDGHATPHGDTGHDALSAALSPEEADAFISGAGANSPDQLADAAMRATGQTAVEGLHTVPGTDVPSNALFGANADSAATSAGGNDTPDVSSVTMDVGHTAATADIAHGPHADAGHVIEMASDILYSNPLPHVLILTAIVVGVATTAVGLALCVRIREAYGTVDEDLLEKMNNDAEFVTTAEAKGAASS